MPIDLEERLRRAAHVLDEQTARVGHYESATGGGNRHQQERSPVGVRLAAACVLFVGLAGTFWAVAHDPSGDPAVGGARSTPPATRPMTGPTSADETTEGSASGPIPPAETLAPMADVSELVPPTVFGTEPTEWYRLQPDLDVAWYSDGGGTSMLCFRTPPGHQCQLDESAPSNLGGGPIGVNYVDDQMLLVTLDPESTITIAFSDGDTIESRIERDPQIGWGVTRVRIPDDASPVGLAMSFDMRARAIAAAPSTAVPSVSASND